MTRTEVPFVRKQWCQAPFEHCLHTSVPEMFGDFSRRSNNLLAAGDADKPSSSPRRLATRRAGSTAASEPVGPYPGLRPPARRGIQRGHSRNGRSRTDPGLTARSSPFVPRPPHPGRTGAPPPRLGTVPGGRRSAPAVGRRTRYGRSTNLPAGTPPCSRAAYMAPTIASPRGRTARSAAVFAYAKSPTPHASTKGSMASSTVTWPIPSPRRWHEVPDHPAHRRTNRSRPPPLTHIDAPGQGACKGSTDPPRHRSDVTPPWNP